MNFSNPLVTWTNASVAATVDRTKDLPVTWTDGNPGTYITIGGVSTSTFGVIGGFTCKAAVGDGKFTAASTYQ